MDFQTKLDTLITALNGGQTVTVLSDISRYEKVTGEVTSYNPVYHQVSLETQDGRVITLPIHRITEVR